VLQRDPLTNDEVIMELYREISMQYVDNVFFSLSSTHTVPHLLSTCDHTPSVLVQLPLASSRHHLSNGGCLEDKRENTVLCYV